MTARAIAHAIVRVAARVRPIFKWYDLWVGVYVDTKRKRVYVFPIPCFGILINYDRTKIVPPLKKT